MTAPRQCLRRLRALFQRRQLEAEMAEEMQLHLDHRVREHLADGLSAEEARYRALRQFGGIEQIKESVRDQRGWRWLEEFVQDLRHAFRQLRKAPGHAGVAVFVLALGIGATTALFNTAYAVLINPFPFAQPDQILCPDIRDAKTHRFVSLNLADHARLAALPGVARSMASTWTMSTLLGAGNPAYVKVVLMSESAFDFLGVAPALGRTLGPGDLQPDGQAAPVAVISHALWARVFHEDPAVIGRTITLDHRTHTIVGVMGPAFSWKTPDGVWTPLSPRDPRARWINSNIRLAPDYPVETFRRDLEGLVTTLVRESPQRFPSPDLRVTCRSFLEQVTDSGQLRESLHLLLYAVGFLLLIACANVANLQLARGAVRSREFAIRLAVGAGRSRLVRQLLAESMALSLVGGALGVAFAFGLTQLIIRLIPPVYFPVEGFFPLTAGVGMSAVVLGFSIGLTVATGLIFGLAPALHCTRPSLNEALKDGALTSGIDHGVRLRRLRSLLVVTEVALAVVLLVGATLSVRGFLRLKRIDPGFRPERTLLLNLPLSLQQYQTAADRNAFGNELLARVVRLPSVASAALGMLPGTEAGLAITVPGRPTPPGANIRVNLVSSDYRRTLGIPLLAGRDFTADETRDARRVALVNEAAARRWFGRVNAVGRTFQIDRLPGANAAAPAPDLTVVGVIGNTRGESLEAAAEPILFIPSSFFGIPRRALVLRTQGDPDAVVAEVRRAVQAMDPGQAISRPITGEEVMGQQIVQPRFTMALFTGLAILGLLLAGGGIYSVLSCHVAQRTQEFGIRRALGASPGAIRRLLFQEGTRLVGGGLLAGLTVAVLLGIFVLPPGSLFPAPDAPALLSATILLAVTAFFACAIPSRHATRVDPIVALHCE